MINKVKNGVKTLLNPGEESFDGSSWTEGYELYIFGAIEEWYVILCV